MAAKIRLPIEFRRQTCKNCNALLVAGSNCRVRVKQKREPHVVITCFKLRQPNADIVKTKKGANIKLSKITTRMKRHVRHVLKDENPTIWVGKEGLTRRIDS